MRKRLQMHQHVAKFWEVAKQLIFHQVAEAVALIDGELPANLDLDVGEEFQSGAANPELFDAADGGHPTRSPDDAPRPVSRLDSLNKLDTPGRGLGGMYLTVLGTSAEGAAAGMLGAEIA
jgi:hypothetical protein